MPGSRALIRVSAWAVAALLVALAASALSLRTYLRSSVPHYEGRIAVHGLDGGVTVYWDSLGVPSIEAGSLADAARAMGFVHARDRLWQMDVSRRAALGELAEVFGRPGLEADRLTRTLGLRRAARSALAALSPRSRQLLDAYAAGVNAYLTEAEGALPVEFLVLTYEPEPWRAEHSLAIGLSMSWLLTEWDYSVELAGALESLPDSLSRELLPAYAGWVPATVPGDGLTPPAPTRRRRPAGSVREWPALATRLPRVPGALKHAMAVPGLSASNAWAVAPHRSASGRALLANDMHLPPRQPPPWYLAGVHAGRYVAAGMTIPGLPLVVAGRTRAVAWGITASMADNLDFYVERFDESDTTRYRTPGGWRAARVVAETVRVRGRPEPEILRFPVTRHGPVIDVGAGDLRVAVSWTGAESGDELAALVAAARAGGWEEFVDAFRGFRNPQLNLVFADSAGHIGYRLVGCVPRRAHGPTLAPVAGWTVGHDWNGCIPFDSLPALVDPAEGFVLSANNLPSRSGPAVGAHFAPGYRALRIREALGSEPTHDARSLARLQQDVLSAFARRYRVFAVEAARRAGHSDAAATLREWDLEARHDARGAALFFVWFEMLVRESVTDEYGPLPSLGREAVAHWLDRGHSPWFDDRRTGGVEGLDAIAARSFERTAEWVGGRAWGGILDNARNHPLSRAAWLERLLALNVEPEPGNGGPYTVKAAFYSGDTLPPVVGFAPSQRHVADFGALDDAGGFILPTGQSGNPFSPHYRDQAGAYERGRLHAIPLDLGRVRALARDSLRLVAVEDSL